MQLTFTNQTLDSLPATTVAGSAVRGRAAGDFIVDQLFPLLPGTLEALEDGANMLFADCGGGKALHRIARRFHRSRFVCIDSLPWNVASAASHARAARIGNLWFHTDPADDIEIPSIYHVVISLDPCNRGQRDPSWVVRIAGAVRPGGVLFFENDNGTARAALIAMGFRRICDVRPAASPQRRFIVAVR